MCLTYRDDRERSVLPRTRKGQTYTFPSQGVPHSNLELARSAPFDAMLNPDEAVVSIPRKDNGRVPPRTTMAAVWGNLGCMCDKCDKRTLCERANAGGVYG